MNSVGESDRSDIVSFALSAFPIAPSNLIKVDQKSSLTSIFLEWDIVDDSQVNVIGYEVWMEESQNGDFIRIYDGKYFPGVNYHNVTGLTTGNTFTFKVVSLNYNGPGALTEPL